MRNRAASRAVLVVLDGFPDIPATEIIDDIALRVFDFVPLEDLYTGFLDEAGYVENLPERNRRNVPADV